LPASQGAHSDEKLEEYNPAAQSEHPDEDTLEYIPASHTKHVADEDAPKADEKVPAGHAAENTHQSDLVCPVHF